PRGHEPNDMLTLQQRSPLVTVAHPVDICLATKLFDNVSAHAPRTLLHSQIFGRTVVTDCQRMHRPRQYTSSTNWRRLFGLCRFVCLHKFRRPGESGQSHAFETSTAKVVTGLTITVDISIDVAREF